VAPSQRNFASKRKLPTYNRRKSPLGRTGCAKPSLCNGTASLSQKSLFSGSPNWPRSIRSRLEEATHRLRSRPPRVCQSAHYRPEPRCTASNSRLETPLFPVSPIRICRDCVSGPATAAVGGADGRITDRLIHGKLSLCVHTSLRPSPGCHRAGNAYYPGPAVFFLGDLAGPLRRMRMIGRGVQQVQ